MRPANEPDRTRARPLARALLLGVAAAALAVLIALARATRPAGPAPASASTPAFASAGPTVVQLQRLRALVSTRVHVADVLVGESRWLRGCWIVRGDALLAVDMAAARVEGKDEAAHTAVVALPPPGPLSARVDHDGTREWDIRSRGPIPLVGALLGDRRALQERAMREAQRLVEHAASSPAHEAAARRHAEDALREFYGVVGWRVSVRWEGRETGDD